MRLNLLCYLSVFVFSCPSVFSQTRKQIETLFTDSEVCNSHFTGFMLYDLDEDEVVYAQNEHLYFSPASNTKLFTLYAALELLGDSIPAIHYQIKGDSLIFWGTGDPTSFREDFDSGKLYSFLKDFPGKLYYSHNNYAGNFYGRSWPYGDYDAYYQAEISAFPFGGNLVHFKRSSGEQTLSIHPKLFSRHLKYAYPEKGKARISVERTLMENDFSLSYDPGYPPLNQYIPFKTSSELTTQLLEDTLKRSVTLVDELKPVTAVPFYSVAADTVYRALMLPSDNFIAEQLLLVCSSLLDGGQQLDAAATIRHAEKFLLADLPDKGQWVDGSGLSRVNFFTPASIVALLKKLWTKVGDENQLHNLLPAGGKTGTLKNAYQTDRGSVFVWGKTGSLNGVHNQSGYLTTRKGKRFIFSFMNNNYVRPTAEVRQEMVRIMTAIRKNY